MIYNPPPHLLSKNEIIYVGVGGVHYPLRPPPGSERKTKILTNSTNRFTNNKKIYFYGNFENYQSGRFERKSE
jgi:hypothetical protein